MDSKRNYLKIRKHFELNDKEKHYLHIKHEVSGYWQSRSQSPVKVTQYVLHNNSLNTSFGGTLFCMCVIFHNK